MTRATVWDRAEAKGAPRSSWEDAARLPFWLDSPLRPEPCDPLVGSEQADLAIVGAGLSGLWAAVLAKQRDPGLGVIVVEGERIASGASGRNGGLLESSLTHGLENGLARFPDQMEALERLGEENFADVCDLISSGSIDCGLELSAALSTAVEPHQVDWLEEAAETAARYGHDVAVLDAEATRAEVASPLYLGGMIDRTGAGMLDPARLSWGLSRVAQELGIRVFEQTEVVRLTRRGPGVGLETREGAIEARRALLASGATRGLVPAIRRRIVPVYDYVLVTEPLTREQLASIGWANRQGLSDSSNQFHYYRLTQDDRILFGGFDAVYHYGSGKRPGLEQSERSSARLAAHFFAVFPQLEGLRFTHRWGGAIDTCSRFFAFYGTAHRGAVAYSVGHTGLGVCASRFGAGVALDLLEGRESESGKLDAIRRRPWPFPPEPLRWAVIALTRNRLAAADRRQGRRGLWLGLLDRLGLGFDS
ncbi:MAG: NAD(P)/FAD-dependent oxidoreductase [Solirubrobacterales bacterium]